MWNNNPFQEANLSYCFSKAMITAYIINLIAGECLTEMYLGEKCEQN